MIRGVKNASLAGQDECPKNVTEVYNYLSKWEGDDTNARSSHNNEGVSFTNNTREPQPWYVKMHCQNCGKIGHIAAFCENAKQADANVQDGEVYEEADQQLYSMICRRTPIIKKNFMRTYFYVKIKNTGVCPSSSRMASMAGESRKNGSSSTVSQLLTHSLTLTCYRTFMRSVVV
jgi:hypothetical protein